MQLSPQLKNSNKTNKITLLPELKNDARSKGNDSEDSDNENYYSVNLWLITEKKDVDFPQVASNQANSPGFSF